MRTGVRQAQFVVLCVDLLQSHHAETFFGIFKYNALKMGCSKEDIRHGLLFGVCRMKGIEETTMD